MTRTALAIATALCLLLPWRASPASGDARDAALEALAMKADLPVARPALPSLLADRDAALRPDDPDGRKKAREKATGEARGAARSEAAKASAAAARAEAVKAVGAAKDDARSAKEKVREEKTRKKPKPPRPDGGASP